MGLDMFLNAKKYLWTDYDKPEKKIMEDGLELKEKIYEIGYWRKHPNLHGYIVQNFANGEDNCREIELGVDELKQIIKAVRGKTLPHTQGFFFGSSDNASIKEDITILTKALDWVKKEEKNVSRYVVYQASW